jgi:hypothetical protein
MMVGVNLPWFGGAYGHDIGRSPANPSYPVTYDSADVENTLARLSKFDISLVRVWLFENGEGICSNEEGEIVGIDPLFLHNIEDLARTFAVVGMRAYWTLLDANSVHRNHDSLTRSILVNPTITEQFIRLCMLPVLERIAGVTWGVDLCNEPEALVYEARLNGDKWEGTWSQVMSGLGRMLDALNDAWPSIPVGVGSGYFEGTEWKELLGRRLGKRLQIVDYHSHQSGSRITLNDPRYAPDQWLVMGELGVGGGDNDVTREDWLQSQENVARKLQTLRNSSFKAVFIWHLSTTSSSQSSSLFFREEPSHALRLAQEINNEEERTSDRASPIAATGAPRAGRVRLPLHLRQMGGSSSCGHRSGWSYVLDCLSAVRCNSQLVLDDFVERTFQWPDCKQVWRAPWVGIIHHPPHFPAWLEASAPLDVIFDSPRFQASKPMLKGVVVLSEHLRRFVESRLDVPVLALKHPSEIPDVRFSIEEHMRSQTRKIVQIGYFSRNIRAIDQLQVPQNFERLHLFDERPWSKLALERIDAHSPWRHRRVHEGVRRLPRHSNEAYDELLRDSLVLCEYFDASASNTVIECIARETPIVVNRNAAVEEYLGSDYPLYFEDIADVADLLSDERVTAAHRHLALLDKRFLSGEAFAQDASAFLESLG